MPRGDDYKGDPNIRLDDYEGRFQHLEKAKEYKMQEWDRWVEELAKKPLEEHDAPPVQGDPGDEDDAPVTPPDPSPNRTPGAVLDAPPGYEGLAAVLQAALDQAAHGKGAQRHARGQAFAAQPMQRITQMVGLGFPIGQAMKKAQEAQGMADRLELAAARAELLGAINYLAGAYMQLDGDVEF